jgi:biopolymer transport protein TolR
MKSIKRKSVINEINVTPLVDVILVLLIVFIITAPMIIPRVDVDLPVVSSSLSTKSEEKEIIITITRGGEIYMQDTLVKLVSLNDEIKKAHSNDKDIRIFIRGDKDAPYDLIVRSLVKLKESGFKKISLVTEN